MQSQTKEPADPAAETDKEPADPAAETDNANYKSKITMATIEASPERAKIQKTRVPVAQIYGIATGSKQVENPMGDIPYTAIVGNFEAVNMHTGDIYRSGVLYLPNGLHDQVLGMLDSLREMDERSKFDRPSVEFALAIDAAPANNPSGYQWVARSLLPPSKADPLTALRTRAHSLLPPPAAKPALPPPT